MACTKIEVFQGVVNPGAYPAANPWRSTGWREIVLVDVRQRSLTIEGQEILTVDKVAIGVSLRASYRVVDVSGEPLHEVANYPDRIYEDVQLATRRYLAARTLDEILRARIDLSDAVRADVREVAAIYGIAISRAEEKDIVFPGKLRAIMNLVLETERTLATARLIEVRKTSEAALLRCTRRTRGAGRQAGRWTGSWLNNSRLAPP